MRCNPRDRNGPADVGLQSGGQDANYLFKYYLLLSREIVRPMPREQILRLLAVEPTGLCAPDLMRLIRPRVSRPTLWRILDGLRSEERITVEGRGRATRYHAESRTDAAGLRSLRLHQFAARRLAGDPELRKVSPLTILVTLEARRRAFENVRTT